MNQRLGSAGVLAGIFIASAVLLYLPELETFKAFGIEARMQKNLIEAKEILEKVRQASIASAKSAYLNFAWANRWGGMSPREKQRALDSVNEQLRAVRPDLYENPAAPSREEYRSAGGGIVHWSPPGGNWN